MRRARVPAPQPRRHAPGCVRPLWRRSTTSPSTRARRARGDRHRRQLPERAEEQRVVHLALDTTARSPLGQQLVVAVAVSASNPNLAAIMSRTLRVRRLDEPVEPCLQRRRRVEQRRERAGKRTRFHCAIRRLLAEAIAAATGVGGVRRPVRIEVVEPAVRTVVDGEPEDRHVVGVHHAVHEADAHPLDDHARGAPRDLVEPCHDGASYASIVPGAGKSRRS